MVWDLGLEKYLTVCNHQVITYVLLSNMSILYACKALILSQVPNLVSRYGGKSFNSDLIEKRMFIKFSMTPILFLYFFHAACPKNILVSTKNTFSCGLAHIYNNEARLYQVSNFYS